MGIGNLNKEELYNQIGVYFDRITNVNDLIEETSDEVVLETLNLKKQEYTNILRELINEKERRIAAGEIEVITPEQYEKDHLDKDFFKDIQGVFKVNHSQRIESGEIDQDYDISFEIAYETFNDRYAAAFKLPAGYQEGYFLKRENNSAFYTGTNQESDFEIFYNDDQIEKIIIYKKNSDVQFVYT